jgi:hypothetical protein
LSGKLVAPGDDVGARHGAEVFRPAQAGEGLKVSDVLLVGAAGVGVGEVGEPLELGGNRGQGVELLGSEGDWRGVTGTGTVAIEDPSKQEKGSEIEAQFKPDKRGYQA